jgi:hypothetical protein
VKGSAEVVHVKNWHQSTIGIAVISIGVGAVVLCQSPFDKSKREGEAPAEPGSVVARQEPRPPAPHHPACDDAVAGKLASFSGDTFEERFGRLKIGMDERRTIEIIGEPDLVQGFTFGSTMIWTSVHSRIEIEFGFGGMSEGCLVTNGLLAASISHKGLRKHSPNGLKPTPIDIASSVGFGTSGNPLAMATSQISRTRLNLTRNVQNR